ncbi:MAG: 5-(carboxyamino)imidazole ribonucleotide synthase [Cyanobacteria bacterium J06638_28]
MSKQQVGVIGGGQLAWMMALEARHLNLDIVVQTPNSSDPAARITESVLAPIADVAGTAILAKHCDVVTFENEFVDLPGLSTLAKQGICFQPQLAALAPLLDKSTQRQFLAAQGLPNPSYVMLEDEVAADEIAQLTVPIGFPLVMKTCRLGYDGQGTFVVSSLAELQATWQRIEHQPVLLEAFIPFAKELAVMVARTASGETALYPVVETQQVQQVCRRVIAPADIPDETQQEIDAIAKTLVTNLDYVGILGIEFFLAPNNTVLVNEVAPRTHNSGHYSLDACRTSQFAQQLLAVTGQPLGDTTMLCDRALMVNLLGYEHAHHDYAAKREALSAVPNAHVHWYGKGASRPGRKLGHVTVCLNADESWEAIAQTLESIWYPPGKS